MTPETIDKVAKSLAAKIATQKVRMGTVAHLSSLETVVKALLIANRQQQALLCASAEVILREPL